MTKTIAGLLLIAVLASSFAAWTEVRFEINRSIAFDCGFITALGVGDTPRCKAEWSDAVAHGFRLP